MAPDDPTTSDSPARRLALVFTLVAVLPLLDIAWMLAQHPPGMAAGADSWNSISCGRTLLISGGLPWLLQWAACVIVFAFGVQRWAGAGWKATLLAVLLPLAAGVAWWAAIAAIWWNAAPVEAALDVLSWSAARRLGVEPFGQFLLVEGLGPLVCPLQLAGPVSMQGWSFLWVGLSTALIMAYWMWAVHALDSEPEAAKRRPRRQFLISMLAAGVYVSPMLIRAAFRVAEAAGVAANLVG